MSARFRSQCIVQAELLKKQIIAFDSKLIQEY